MKHQWEGRNSTSAASNGLFLYFRNIYFNKTNNIKIFNSKGNELPSKGACILLSYIITHFE